jgi:DNA-binding NarL/FixJ family response regulator
VVVVKSEEQALAYLKKHETELIILDCDSPEQNSYDKEKLIRAHFKEISKDEIISQINEFFEEGC